MADFIELENGGSLFLVNVDQITFINEHSVWLEKDDFDIGEGVYERLKSILHVVQLRNPVQSVEKDNDAESQ